ncbi:MAG TPA: plastocyanin/azurin family copper-binding protein [Mycobacteriales bacterium]|nr:plastocyanin/azurin family copper-binding protein [Mycobacteriales bacterium]
MRARRTLPAVLLLAAVGAVAGSMAAPASGASATVTVLDNQFSPVSVTVVAGDSVTWSFSGSNAHSVTADPGQAISFDSHPQCTTGGACSSSGQTHVVEFAQPGFYRYFCKVHGGPGGAGMSGTVEVQMTPQSPSPGASSFTPTPGTTHSHSASPLPSGSSQPPTLVAPTTAVAGVVVAVSGTAAPGALVEVFGVTAPNATLLKVNETTADSAGNWSRTIRPLRNVNLQARSGGQVSPTRFIAVRTAVRESVAALAGCVVQVSGSVFEPKPGRTVFLRAVDSTGRTVSLGTGTVQSDGRFLLRRPYPCGQTLRVYAVIEGDNVNRPGATGTQTVSTRR